jgi:hypothetical protein
VTEVSEKMEIPKPEDTGSAGTQRATTEEVILDDKRSPLSGLPIAHTVEGLAATRSRSLGGEVAAGLIAGSFAQMSYDFQTIKQELYNTREEQKSILKELSEVKTENAVLKERLRVQPKGRLLRKLIITIGTVLIPIGIELYRNNFDKLGYIVGAFGVLLLLFGWFSKE